MKKHLLLPGALAFATLSGVVPAGAEPVDPEVIVEIEPARTNLIANPGFEDGLTGWSKLNASSSGTLTTSDDAHSGTTAAHFSGTTPGVSFVRFDNPLPDTSTGAVYSLGVWAALAPGQPLVAGFTTDPEPPSGPNFTLAAWTDGDALARFGTNAESDEITGAWSFHTLTFTLPEDGYDRTYPEIYLGTTNTNFLFDDMVLIPGKFTPPSAPGNVVVETGTTSATVTWDPSSVDWDSGEAQASEVSRYVVTATPTDTKLTSALQADLTVPEETALQCDTDGLSCTIEGLEPGTDYDVTVVAHNAVGGGKAGIVTASTLAEETGTPAEQEIDELAPLRKVHAEREQAGQSMTNGHGITARLYWAVLGRAPEEGGARFWFEAYDSGEWDLRRIAAHFADSSEFRTRFGTDLSNAAFAELVYTNALGRTPDADGLAFWIEQLDNGMLRSEMVLLVSDSPEFRVAHPLPWEL